MVGSSAHAQGGAGGPDERPVSEMSEAERQALARDQFTQGMRFARRSRWQQAADRFARALELKETPQIRYNLAESLVHLGRLVEASEQLRLLEEEEDVPRAVARPAVQLRETVNERLGRLRIDVRNMHTGVRVTLDGRDLPEAVLGVDHHVDPGRHLVRLVVDDGEVVQSEEVMISDGATEIVQLVAPALPPVSPTPSSTEATEEGEDEGGSLWWLWTTVALLVVGGGVVATYFILSDMQSPTQGDFMPGVLEIR
jgi:hypothetical protein